MICFRVDGNSAIGAGHVIRCLSVADVLKRKGQTCLFIMASEELREAVTERGHEVIIIKENYSKMCTEALLPIINDLVPSMVIVDSYFVSYDYLSRLYSYLSSRGILLVYLDDRYEFPYPCDFLINYNLFSNHERYKDLYNDKLAPQMLLGTAYAPLRNEFVDPGNREISSLVSRAFVSTGGSDAEHLTLELIHFASNSRLKYTFVVGAMNPDKEEIQRIAKGIKNITVRDNVARMSDEMLSCDIAVSAAGSTLYELCATQTPTITYILSDNQIPAAEAFEKNGIMINCGDIREMGRTAIARRLIELAEELANDPERRKKMADLMRVTVDGKGAKRIAEVLLSH